MALRLEHIIHDIEEMSVSLSANDRRFWLEEARRLLYTYDRNRMVTKLGEHQKTERPMLAPIPLGELYERVEPPDCPRDYTVVAADGSNIPPERDSPARFYLLNSGLVTLSYGAQPEAKIDSWAQLYYRRDDLYWDADQHHPIDSDRLSLLMRIEEIAVLPDLAEQTDPALRCVALVDGQLIMWGLQKEVKDRWNLMERLIDTFERLYELRIPIVGYISGTESFELINALRIYLCPASPNNCHTCEAKAGDDLALCYHLNGFRDPALLFNFLDKGERSCCFASQAEILKRYPEEHRIVYFYINTGDEIARVEVPRWVADDPSLLNLVHATLYDQCERSGQQPPYPPALHEAHEAAVISTGDRRAVQMLVEEQLERQGMPTFRPAKAFHKRTRGV